MPKSFLDFEPASLANLSADDAVALFTRLLWGSAFRHGVPPSSISITGRTNIPDGGIDAEVAPNAVAPGDDLLMSGNSFFQIKAGTSAVPWQKKWITRELLGLAKKRKQPALGSAVLHCLKSHGRYVLVCFGCDPTPAQRRNAVRHIKEVFATNGFRKARVDFWGQSVLAGLMQPFPSLKFRFSNRHDLPFLTHDEWKNDATMKTALHLGEPQVHVVREIQGYLRDGEFPHVRLIGEPGLGKTRIALEALSAADLEASVVYVRHPEDLENSPLFTALLRSDGLSTIILVVDDCREKHRASIWNVLRERSKRIKLITLDHAPETSHDRLMKVIDCPALDREKIKSILGDYLGVQHDLDRWAEFCSGSPRVAHAVGENLATNPDDVLRAPATVPIWERFLHGATPSGSVEEGQHELVLRHIALFQRLGFEPPVQEEAKFVATLVEHADPTITWARFQSIVKRFRDRRILQGKATLFFVPRALHIHLWLEFWDHYGAINVSDLLSRMPESLFRWFAEMFKYGHISKRCLSRIEELLAVGGPFDDPAFMRDGRGSPFLNELAEAHPKATLACIERTIGQWPDHDIATLSSSRQYLVWALEKIAIWKDCFQGAAFMLLKLALEGDGSHSNNAAGTFCELFDMGYDRMASTEAPPEHRLPVLRRALTSGDKRVRTVAVRALARALAEHPHTKIFGPSQQGLRPIPALWNPKTWKEVHDAYRAAWRLAVEFWRTQVGEEKVSAMWSLIDAAFHLVQWRALEEEVIATIREIVSDGATDLRPIVQFLTRFRSIRWRSVSRRTAAAMRRIEQTLAGDDLPSQIRRVVLLSTFDDLDHGSDGVYGKAHAAKIYRLARALLERPNLQAAVISKLTVEPGMSVPQFGFALGQHDADFTLTELLVNSFLATEGARRSDLLTGYLAAIFSKNRQRWELVVLQLLKHEVARKYARHLVLGSGMTETILDRICELVEKNLLDEESLDGFAFARSRGPISLDRCMRFVSWCVALSRPALVQCALETSYVIFAVDKEPQPIPEQPILELLTKSGVIWDRDRSAYEWSVLTDIYARSFTSHAVRIFERALLSFANPEVSVRLAHSQAQQTLIELIKLDPHGAWQTVAQLMELPGKRFTWSIAHWLGSRYGFGEDRIAGPLAAFDAEDVLRWVAGSPAERAHLIAGACPKTFDLTHGRLTREILIRYGAQDNVQGALHVNFGTESISGPASQHYRKKREKMQKWLACETELPIISWLEAYIGDLGRQISREEIKEEREY